MSEIKICELDSRIQKQLDSAVSIAEKGNALYAVDIFSQIIQKHPECLEVRKLLRQTQIKIVGNIKGGLKKFIKKISSVSNIVKGDLATKDPQQAINDAERMLNSDPYNVAANNLLARAAKALGLDDTVVFAYETIKEIEPNSIDNLLALGEAYIVVGKNKDAVWVGDEILKFAPSNSEAQILIKKASVAQTVDEGNWQESDDYRQKLKDESASIELEQVASSHRDEDAQQNLINKTLKQIEMDPGNIALYREISHYLYESQKFPESLDWLQKARTLPIGKLDASLEKEIIEMTETVLKKLIDEKSAVLSSNPENNALKIELTDAVKELDYYRLNQISALVEKYPQDLGHRYEYGVLLLSKGKMEEAAKQFQMSKQSPKYKINSLLYLGKSFKEDKKYDLAVSQFREARSEVTIMDDLKKEIIYELADAYEKMGDKENAFTELKEIYAADIGYRDVAERINQYYNN